MYETQVHINESVLLFIHFTTATLKTCYNRPLESHLESHTQLDIITKLTEFANEDSQNTWRNLSAKHIRSESSL